MNFSSVATDLVRDDDDIFRELEDAEDEDSFRIRELRLFQLKREMNQIQEMKDNNHGAYENISEEKEILRLTTSVKRCIIHFYHLEFRRCQIMDSHLEKLSRKHFKTKFAKIEVSKAPFLIERLKIQILPCVVAFIDGVAVDRIVGFEKLGGTDSFTTEQLESVLTQSAVLIVAGEKQKQRKSIFGFKEDSDSEED